MSDKENDRKEFMHEGQRYVTERVDMNKIVWIAKHFFEHFQHMGLSEVEAVAVIKCMEVTSKLAHGVDFSKLDLMGHDLEQYLIHNTLPDQVPN